MPASTLLKLVPAGNGFDVVCSIRNTAGAQFGNSAHYVTRVTFSVNGEMACELNCGPGISDNPLVGIHLATVDSGDQVSVMWVDSSGNRGRAQATVGINQSIVIGEP
jgi:hypothetical protein